MQVRQVFRQSMPSHLPGRLRAQPTCKLNATVALSSKVCSCCCDRDGKLGYRLWCGYGTLLVSNVAPLSTNLLEYIRHKAHLPTYKHASIKAVLFFCPCGVRTQHVCMDTATLGRHENETHPHKFNFVRNRAVCVFADGFCYARLCRRRSCQCFG